MIFWMGRRKSLALCLCKRVDVATAQAPIKLVPLDQDVINIGLANGHLDTNGPALTKSVYQTDFDGNSFMY